MDNLKTVLEKTSSVVKPTIKMSPQLSFAECLECNTDGVAQKIKERFNIPECSYATISRPSLHIKTYELHSAIFKRAQIAFQFTSLSSIIQVFRDIGAPQFDPFINVLHTWNNTGNLQYIDPFRPPFNNNSIHDIIALNIKYLETIELLLGLTLARFPLCGCKAHNGAPHYYSYNIGYYNCSCDAAIPNTIPYYTYDGNTHCNTHYYNKNVCKELKPPRIHTRLYCSSPICSYHINNYNHNYVNCNICSFVGLYQYIIVGIREYRDYLHDHKLLYACYYFGCGLSIL